MAVKDRLVIAMYTLRDIQYGEELSFDYNSVTESIDEWRAAACLCGSRRCRGSFLYYSNSKAFQQILAVQHTVYERTRAILHSCENPTLSSSDAERLVRHGFSVGGAARDGLPKWAEKWGSSILAYAERERDNLPTELCIAARASGYPLPRSFAEMEATTVFNNRVQNLAITFDKIKHVVQEDTSNKTGPLRRVTPKEILTGVWDKKEKVSMIARLLSACSKYTPPNEWLILGKLTDVVYPPTAEGVSTMRQQLVLIRDVLRSLASQNPAHAAAADLVHLYARTKCSFTTKPFKRVVSPPVTLRECDVGDTVMAFPVNNSNVAPKGYVCFIFFFTMNFFFCNYWERQTIAEPDASLTAARYGTIVLPSPGCCYSNHNLKWGPAERQEWLQWAGEKPHVQWPTRWHWRFKNPAKLYGGPGFDECISRDSSIFYGVYNSVWKSPDVSQTSEGVVTSDSMSTSSSSENDSISFAMTGVVKAQESNPISSYPSRDAISTYAELSKWELPKVEAKKPYKTYSHKGKRGQARKRNRSKTTKELTNGETKKKKSKTTTELTNGEIKKNKTTTELTNGEIIKKIVVSS
eukprot:GSMAST32.ASY1.ANO1.1242.1 assembled CDS